MAKRYPGDGAAANGFDRRTLQTWEARMYEAGYMAPPDTRMPPGWTLSVGGIPIPPAPMPVELSYDVQEYIDDMDNPAEAESADKLLY